MRIRLPADLRPGLRTSRPSSVSTTTPTVIVARWRAGEVRRLVFKQSFLPVGVGLGTGLVASSLLGGPLRSLLFGVGRTDPWMMTAAVALIIAVAAVAVSVPARRATRIDPLLALRCE
jgi:ABC-type antimicrobial peptide transport system permease subunit